jgi:hypothetical protein
MIRELSNFSMYEIVMISLVVGKLCDVVAVDDVVDDDNGMREEQDFTSLYTYTLV